MAWEPAAHCMHACISFCDELRTKNDALVASAGVLSRVLLLGSMFIFVCCSWSQYIL